MYIAVGLVLFVIAFAVGWGLRRTKKGGGEAGAVAGMRPQPVCPTDGYPVLSPTRQDIKPRKDDETVAYFKSYAPLDHDPGQSVDGGDLDSSAYCRSGLDQEQVVEGENDLWRFRIYTVTPSAVNLKFYKVQN